jgi:hypothetical protein
VRSRWGALVLPAAAVAVAAETACLELSTGRLCGVLADAGEGLAELLVTTPATAPTRPA